MLIDVIDQIAVSTKELPLLDRGELFGDGFFTTGIIKQHQLCYQQQHIERLKKSAKILQFAKIDFSLLENKLKAVCTKVANATIRISFSRRQKQRGYAIAEEGEFHCRIILSELASPPKQSCELVEANTAVSYNPSLAGIKHNNRLDSVLAATEITNQYQEALMFHNDTVICGSKSNLFVKLNNKWVTPDLTFCGIHGITRNRVLKAFANNNIEHEIRTINRAELNHVSSAFMTNSLIGVWPVSKINQRQLDLIYCNEIKHLIQRT